MSMKDTFSQFVEEAFDSKIDSVVKDLSQEIARIAKELREKVQDDAGRVWLEPGPRHDAYREEVRNRDYRSELIGMLQTGTQPTVPPQPEAGPQEMDRYSRALQILEEKGYVTGKLLDPENPRRGGIYISHNVSRLGIVPDEEHSTHGKRRWIKISPQQPKAPSFEFDDKEKNLIRKYARDSYSSLSAQYEEPEKLGVESNLLANEVAIKLFPDSPRDTRDFRKRVAIIRLMLSAGKEGSVNPYGFQVHRKGEGQEKRTYVTLPEKREEVSIWPLIDAVVDRYDGNVPLTTLQEEVLQAGNISNKGKGVVHTALRRYGSDHGYEIREEEGGKVVHRTQQNKADGQTAPYTREPLDLEILPDGSVTRTLSNAERGQITSDFLENIGRYK